MGLLKLIVLTVLVTLALSALASAQMGAGGLMGGGGLFPILMLLMRSGIDMKNMMPLIWMMMSSGGGMGGFGAM